MKIASDGVPVDRRPLRVDVATLVSIKAPENPVSRVSPIETSTWTVRATLVAYKVEADRDVHLVLKDKGKTMIAEIPSPACMEHSPLTADVATARAAFDARFAERNSVVRTSAPVTVTGVGFFDRLHGQLGVAPNGVELHPVTALAFGP